MLKSQKYLNILTGILLALAFPPMPFYFLSFIAFIPFLFVNEKFKDKNSGLGLSIYLTFMVYHTGTNWWISSFQEQTDPFLMASGFALDVAHPLFFFIPIYIYRFIRRKLGFVFGLVSFPFIWTAFEWAHSLGEFSYPWLTVGNTQIYNIKWIQFIDITGVWGSSFLICSINVMIFSILYKIYKMPKEDRLIGYIIRIPGMGLRISFIAILFLAPIFYGTNQLKEFNHEKLISENESLIATVIQPNINPWEKWGSGPGSQVKLMMDIQDSVIKSSVKTNLSVWPETSILRLGKRINNDLNMSFIQMWTDRRELSLLSGFIHDDEYGPWEKRQITARLRTYDSTWYESFNAAVLVQPGFPAQVYHKSKLTPFAERIPYVNHVSFLMDYIQWGVGISSWGLGSGADVVDLSYKLQNYKLGNIICIESIYPGFCRDFTKNGAQLLTLITNDAWYDFTPGPEQHFCIAQVRAIENRRYIARSANSGVSGFISPTGEEVSRLAQYEKGALSEKIAFLDHQSFYVRYGDWFGFLVGTISLLMFLISFFLRIYNAD